MDQRTALDRLTRAAHELQQRRPQVEKRERYARGDQELPFAPQGVNQEYIDLQEQSIDRAVPAARRRGARAAPRRRLDQDRAWPSGSARRRRACVADDIVWSGLWQANKLDTRQSLIYRSMDDPRPRDRVGVAEQGAEVASDCPPRVVRPRARRDGPGRPVHAAVGREGLHGRGREPDVAGAPRWRELVDDEDGRHRLRRDVDDAVREGRRRVGRRVEVRHRVEPPDAGRPVRAVRLPTRRRRPAGVADGRADPRAGRPEHDPVQHAWRCSSLRSVSASSPASTRACSTRTGTSCTARRRTAPLSSTRRATRSRWSRPGPRRRRPHAGVPRRRDEKVFDMQESNLANYVTVYDKFESDFFSSVRSRRSTSSGTMANPVRRRARRGDPRSRR